MLKLRTRRVQSEASTFTAQHLKVQSLTYLTQVVCRTFTMQNSDPIMQTKKAAVDTAGSRWQPTLTHQGSGSSGIPERSTPLQIRSRIYVLPPRVLPRRQLQPVQSQWQQAVLQRPAQMGDLPQESVEAESWVPSCEQDGRRP